MSRRASAAAWALASVAVAAVIGAAVLGAAIGKPPEDFSWVLSWLGFPVVGGIVASRRPRHPVGWLLIGIGACLGLAVGASVYADYAIIDRGGAFPAGAIVLWLAQPVLIVGLALLPIFVLYFPTGGVSRRWNRIAQIGASTFTLLIAANLFRSSLQLGSGKRIANPAGIPAIAGLLDLAVVPLSLAAFAFAGAVCAHLVWRYGQSAGVVRRQLKWFTFAVAVTALLWILGVASYSIIGSETLGGLLIVGSSLIGLNGIAASVGIAILRHRLYDIDRVISRTLSYAIVTAVLAGTFALVVLAPTAAIGATGRTPDWLIAVATLAAAAGFRPIRRRVQETVDHRFNRRRYDAARTIESFAGRLRDEVDIETLRVDLEALVHQTMQPAHVSVWLRTGLHEAEVLKVDP